MPAHGAHPACGVRVSGSKDRRGRDSRLSPLASCGLYPTCSMRLWSPHSCSCKGGKTIPSMVSGGRVPVECREYCDTSPKPPGWSASAGHHPSTWVIKTSFQPVGRIASTRVLPCITIILFATPFHRVRGWPRWHARAQHCLQRPPNDRGVRNFQGNPSNMVDITAYRHRVTFAG